MARKESKTFILNLLSGRHRRVKKNEVCCVCEQVNIEGAIDTIVYMISGHSYLVQDTKKNS
ncbi:MAG: hypothetical protein ACK5N8_06705 [Alphaproteobacteria bacterium]